MEIKLKIAELPKSGKINSLIDYATDNKSLIFSDSFEKYSCSTKIPSLFPYGRRLLKIFPSLNWCHFAKLDIKITQIRNNNSSSVHNFEVLNMSISLFTQWKIQNVNILCYAKNKTGVGVATLTCPNTLFWNSITFTWANLQHTQSGLITWVWGENRDKHYLQYEAVETEEWWKCQNLGITKT